MAKSRKKNINLSKIQKNDSKICEKFGKLSKKEIVNFLQKTSFREWCGFQNGAEECIVKIAARVFRRVFTCKIWLRYSRERAYLISLVLIRLWSFNFSRALPPPQAAQFLSRAYAQLFGEKMAIFSPRFSIDFPASQRFHLSSFNSVQCSLAQTEQSALRTSFLSFLEALLRRCGLI